MYRVSSLMTPQCPLISRSLPLVMAASVLLSSELTAVLCSVGPALIWCRTNFTDLLRWFLSSTTFGSTGARMNYCSLHRGFKVAQDAGRSCIVSRSCWCVMYYGVCVISVITVFFCRHVTTQWKEKRQGIMRLKARFSPEVQETLFFKYKLCLFWSHSTTDFKKLEENMGKENKENQSSNFKHAHSAMQMTRY